MFQFIQINVPRSSNQIKINFIAKESDNN